MTLMNPPASPRALRILPVLFVASTAFAAVIFAHALIIGRTPGETTADIWELIFLCPALAAFVWLASAHAAKRRVRESQPQWGEDAARSASRVTHVGGRFLVGIALVPLFIQGVWISGMFGVPQSLSLDPNLVMRAVFFALGMLFVYFGNIVPKMPLSARPKVNPAAHRRSSRLLGWVLVIHGVAICIGALLLAGDMLGPAWLVAVASMLLAGLIAATGPHILHRLKSRSMS